jgi:hypothetical protein
MKKSVTAETPQNFAFLNLHEHVIINYNKESKLERNCILKMEKNIMKKHAVQLEPKVYIHAHYTLTCFG